MKTKFFSIHLIVFILWSFCISLIGQNIIRIPVDYPTIQQGLNAAQANTTILVSPGIYYENLIWPYHIDGIKLIGIEGSTKTIIDGGYNFRVITIEGSFPFPDSNAITIATLLQGLTIRHGQTTDKNGAGLYCSFASPRLNDLQITNNLCDGKNCFGGGAFLEEYYGIIENCNFADNKIEAIETAYGAGLYVKSVNFKMLNCTIKNNSGNSKDYSQGGGVYIQINTRKNLNENTKILILNCHFLENSTQTDNSSFGGGVFIADYTLQGSISVLIDSCLFYKNETKNSNWSSGGGLFTQLSRINIRNSKFIENKAVAGAGLTLGSHNNVWNIASIENTNIVNNQTLGNSVPQASALYIDYSPFELLLENVVMSNNQSRAIYLQNNESMLTMNHCTSYNNEGNTSNGILINAINSVFWNKTNNEFSQFGPFTNINLSHCIVKGGYPGIGNFDKDPLMLNAHLPIPGINSPCFNAGVLIPDIKTDINGFPRPMPINSLPDIGAYEMDQYFAHVLVKYYYDLNQNGIKDINERYLNFGSVKDHTGQTHVNYSENGSYIILQQGMASIQFVEDITSDWKSRGQNFYQFNVNSAQFSETVEIGLYPQTTQSKLSTIVYGNNFRCGEVVRFTITLTNNGTTIESGFFWLKMDDRLDSIRFTDLPDNIISKHEFSWRYQALYPGESITKEFFVLAPRINNPNELGEIYKFCHGVSGLSLRDDNCYLAELRCSFDPNDKFSIPQRADQFSLKGEPMIYTIRFQNTGNDYARNVIIHDNIDRSFNLNSLKILQTSHPNILEVSYDDARELIFSFKDIFLPDSTTNYESSNGYVIYSLEYNDGISENTVVNNTANIFFDFNPAIVTNATHNIVVTEYPTNTSNPNENRIFVYPNPATNYLQFSKNVDRSILFNLQGQMIHQSSNTNNLNIHSAPGTYILRLEAEGYFYYHKVLVIGN